MASPPGRDHFSPHPLPERPYQSRLRFATRTGWLLSRSCRGGSSTFHLYQTLPLCATGRQQLSQPRCRRWSACKFESNNQVRCELALAGHEDLQEVQNSEISKRDLRRASASSAVPCFTVVTNQWPACKRGRRIIMHRNRPDPHEYWVKRMIIFLANRRRVSP